METLVGSGGREINLLLVLVLVLSGLRRARSPRWLHREADVTGIDVKTKEAAGAERSLPRAGWVSGSAVAVFRDGETLSAASVTESVMR